HELYTFSLHDALPIFDGDLGRVRRVVRIGVFVQSADGFTDQPLVANGASELLQNLFGEAGQHARAAVGVNALPLNASVEIEFLLDRKSTRLNSSHVKI